MTEDELRDMRCVKCHRLLLRFTMPREAGCCQMVELKCPKCGAKKKLPLDEPHNQMSSYRLSNNS